ncbi:MAG: haloacid dehalogenase-like hydrolase [bacterium]
MTNETDAVGERVPIAAFDLDGTLTRINSGTALMMLLCEKDGLVSSDVRRQLNSLMEKVRFGEITFESYEGRLERLILRGLCGLRPEDVEIAAALVAATSGRRTFSFTGSLLATVRNTHHCLAVTGSLGEVAERLAKSLDFHGCIPNRMKMNGGRYSNRLIEPPTHTDKGGIVRRLVEADHELTLTGSLAIGDAGSDISMLEAVEWPIAFNPNPGLAAAAARHGWPIVTERKGLITVLEAEPDARHGQFRQFGPDEVDEAVACALDAAERTGRR